MSLVIPAYLAARTIAATLDSVLAQTFPDYEIILVNDGSPDTEEMETVLAPYLSRITYVRQENQGPAGARNTGIGAARGEYIALLDADDQWEPEHLAVQVQALESDQSIDMIYADARIFGDVRDRGHTVMELSPSEGEVTFERLVTRRCTVILSVTVARRQAFVDTGLFDPAFRGTEDIDMWLRMAKRGRRIVYQRRVLGRYRRQAFGLSAAPVRMIEGFLAVLAKAAQAAGVTPEERRTIEGQCVIERARLALEKGKRAFLAGQMDVAVRELTAANAHFRSAKLTLVLMLLHVAPRLLQAFYHWRDRHFFKLKTEP